MGYSMHHSSWCRCYRIRKYIRFSGSGSSHQNEEAEYTIKKVITMVTNTIVLLLCFRPSVHVMCPNHDVVVFQPCTGTAPYLGSGAKYTFYSNPPSPPVLTNFLDIFIVPICPIAPPSVVFLLIPPISIIPSPPSLPSLINFHLDIYRSCHPPAFATRLFSLPRMSTCSALSHDCAIIPFAALGMILPSRCTII